MNISEKYGASYFMPPEITYDWVQKDRITVPPVWCSVDLRDGNQALIEPMGLQEKIEYFKMLVDIGFQEIEVGFPAASETEFQFVRTLIERKMIPDNVTIQVLTQARESIIQKTFEAIKGAKRVIVHMYSATSPTQREQVLHKSKDEVKEAVVAGATLIKQLSSETNAKITFEFTPESFQETEVEYAVEVCNAVLDVWQPTSSNKVIVNIPTTVQIAMPHVFACQVEYMHKHLKYRDNLILSVHPHNDRGSSISDAELGLLAGAERVEGTLFGNGERTGNVDIVTLAMNMVCHGVNPNLDFRNLNEIREKFQQFVGIMVHERQPYAGDLVFAAFSGSHQDAISKGMNFWKDGKTNGKWTVPYLPIDPEDVGRKYDNNVIRINSHSGKGGVAFVLKQNYGIVLPNSMKEEVGYLMKTVSDQKHQELLPKEIYRIFLDSYVNHTPVFHIPQCHFVQDDGISAKVNIVHGKENKMIMTMGNGRLDAVSNAIRTYFGVDYELLTYEEHAISKGSSSKAAAFVSILSGEKTCWGVGIDEDIIKASIAALVSAANKLLEERHITRGREERIVDIMNYIQNNYKDISLEVLVEKFHLTKPYLSKYIKMRSGLTFQDAVREARMKKARILLKESGQTVKSIAATVGYEKVEHFNRLFKKTYGITPIQYRQEDN